MLLQHRGEALSSALLLAALCTSWLLFGWTENNVMTISCNIWFYFYLLSVFSVGRGEGGECISSHNISNGTIQCSLYNLRSGSQSLSAGVSSDSATAPRPRLWLRLCVSVSESLSPSPELCQLVPGTPRVTTPAPASCNFSLSSVSPGDNCLHLLQVFRWQQVPATFHSDNSQWQQPYVIVWVREQRVPLSCKASYAMPWINYSTVYGPPINNHYVKLHLCVINFMFQTFFDGY